MPEGVLGLLDVIAQPYIQPILRDGVMRDDPFLAMLKRKCLVPYIGGKGEIENATYDVFDVLNTPGTSIQLPAGMNGNQVEYGYPQRIAHYTIPIFLDLEQLSDGQWGSTIKLDPLKTRLKIAALSLSARLAIDMYKYGGVGDRLLSPNGLDDGISDGVTNGVWGITHPNYRGIARNLPQGEPVKTWMAPQSIDRLRVQDLENTIDALDFGVHKPDTIITTLGAQGGFGIIRRTLVNPLVRAEFGDDPDFGFRSIRVHGVKIFGSQYAPGRRPATAVDTKLGYVPVAGETIYFLDMKSIAFRVHAHPMRNFALWPFVFVPGTTGHVVGQYKTSVNLEFIPGFVRANHIMHGLQA